MSWLFSSRLDTHFSPLTSEVVGAPQMTLQQYLSTLPCFPLSTGNLQTPFLSIPWCYLIISSSVFLSFLFLSLSPAELSSPCQRILRCGHTIWVSGSLPWLGGHRALQFESGFCCEPLRPSHGLCRKCSEVSYSISSQGIESFSRFLDLKLRKHIADLDLIDKDVKDRIYKWKGALTKVDMTKDRVDHKPHLPLLSLSHISWTFIFNFQNDDLPLILGNRTLFGQNVI